MDANRSINETVSWQVNEGRGTWDVLSSCVLTLILCVWSALHLNIPQQNATLWDRIKTKTVWVIFGILAPEIVVYIAWVQYTSAKYLLQEIRSLEADGTASKSSHQKPADTESGPETASLTRHKWTMAHCYFAGMGGFAFDSGLDDGGEPFIPGSPNLHFTSHAILLLAKLHKLPNVSIAQIRDKSKADGLAKCIVCLQASWMLLQCVGRLAARLPITLLEINTIGHCFCALIIYLIWWSKPLEVQEPIVLTGDWMRGFTSYAWMRSESLGETLGDVSDLGNIWKGMSTTDSNKTPIVFKSDLSRLQVIRWEQQSDQAQQAAIRPVITSAYTFRLSGAAQPCPGQLDFKTRRVYSRETLLKSFPPDGLVLYEDEAIEGVNFVLSPTAVNSLSTIYHYRGQAYKTSEIRRHHQDRRFLINLSRADFFRWVRASDFLEAVRGVSDSDIFEYVTSFRRLDDILATLKISNYPRSGQYAMGEDDQIRIVFILSIASAAYGGLHLASWHAHFPTIVEKWLWISSSIFVAFVGCLPFISMIALGLSIPCWNQCKKYLRQIPKLLKLLEDIFTMAFLGLFCLAIIVFPPLYCFTRAFIVVEAFISLRQLPLSYYDTPIWTNFIPHM